MVIGTIEQANALIDSLKKLHNEWTSLVIQDASVYCSCGDKRTEGSSLYDVESFLKRHIERGHKLHIDISMRVKLDVS